MHVTSRIHFNIKTHFLYRDYLYKHKTIVKACYLCYGISFTDMIAPLYWDGPSIDEIYLCLKCFISTEAAVRIIQESFRKHHAWWCVSSWQPCFWSVYPIYHYIFTMYYSCILSNWNKLFLRDLYIQRVGVAITVCLMIWYCYSFLSGFKCIVQDSL